MKTILKVVVVLGLFLIISGCASPPDPYDYGGVYHYRMTDLQKQALRSDLSAVCEEVELTEPETVEHKKCIANRIKERDQRIHEEQVARASAPVTNTYTTNTNTTNVQQNTCVGDWC